MRIDFYNLFLTCLISCRSCCFDSDRYNVWSWTVRHSKGQIILFGRICLISTQLGYNNIRILNCKFHYSNNTIMVLLFVTLAIKTQMNA